jgi:hypothetical protein
LLCVSKRIVRRRHRSSRHTRTRLWRSTGNGECKFTPRPIPRQWPCTPATGTNGADWTRKAAAG